MPEHDHWPSPALRRRRLRAIATTGFAAVLVAAASDVVRDRVAPELAASVTSDVAAGDDPADTTTSSSPPDPRVVWSGPPSAPAPLAADTGGSAPVITRVETTDPVVFLTVDDGITRTAAGRQAFASLGIPASLFLVDGPIEDGAAWFRSLPDTVVESHTRSHPDMTTLSEAAQRDQICGNADLIEQTFGRRPVLFRPPYGSYDAATQRAAAACGMRALVLWQETVNADVVAFREVPQLRPGDIILMHFRPSFVQELQVIRERVVQSGLRFALLEDYVAPDTLPAG